MSDRPTHSVLWRSGDYSCILVTHSDMVQAEVHIYKGSTVIGFETCVDPEDASAIAERLWSALIEPV